MIFNLFYLFGIMDSINATLTLPGIAWYCSHDGIAVDTNVIIYERTKEELFAGKSIKQAYTDGFKHALNAIIDGHPYFIVYSISTIYIWYRTYQRICCNYWYWFNYDFLYFCILSRVMIFHRLNKGKSLSVWTPMDKKLVQKILDRLYRKKKICLYIFCNTYYGL